jgi:N-acetylneuraminic acid mutarotase
MTRGNVLGYVGLTLLAAVLLTAPPVLAQAPRHSSEATPTTSPWLELTPIPQARSEFAGAAIGPHIFVAGGFDSEARFDRFDTDTGEWRRLARLPEEVHHPGVAALDGRVYVAGGYRIDDMREVGTVWAYDTTRNVWERRADLPTPRGAFGLVALDGRLYAVGGARVELGGPVTGAVEVYDPATNTWQRLAALPTPREHLAVIALDGRIYAIGGRANGDEGDEFASANEVYDPATNHWSALAPLPVPRGGLAGVAVAGQVVVLGGERGQTTFADVDAFDPATNTWTALPAMPTARHGLAAAAVGETIYAIAGSTRAGTVDNTPVVEALPRGAWQEGRA